MNIGMKHERRLAEEDRKFKEFQEGRERLVKYKWMVKFIIVAIVAAILTIIGIISLVAVTTANKLFETL